jgi:hypothetical protein
LVNKSINQSSVFTHGVTISLLVKESIEEQNPTHHASIVKGSIEEQNPTSQELKPDDKKYQTTVCDSKDQIHPLFVITKTIHQTCIIAHNV